MNDELFTRTLTNAEKAGLILYLLDIGLPDWTDDENEDLIHVFCAFTGMPYDTGKRAFADAIRFGLADKKGDTDVNNS